MGLEVSGTSPLIAGWWENYTSDLATIRQMELCINSTDLPVKSLLSMSPDCIYSLEAVMM